MKKSICRIMCLVMLLCACRVSALAQTDSVVLVLPDQTTTICVPADAPPQQQYAASQLQQYLQQITDTRIALVNTPDAQSDCTIYVEAPAADAADAPGEDSYRIRTDGKDLHICGGGNRGAIYGVFAFLEQCCGYRRYTADMQIVPRSQTITVPSDFDIRYDACFEYRETDWLSPRNREYSLANGLNGGVYRYIPENMGGTVGYIGGFCHTFTYMFCSAETYYKTHPEYFALHYGVRTSDQLCLTNPDVLRVVTDEVLNLLKEQHDPTKSIQIISLTQADNKRFCTCKNCVALDRANGSHAGTMISFVNAVAAAVKAAGYDNVALDTFAYQYTRKAPTKVVPADNVIVRLCSIECCFGHAFDDASCPNNRVFMQDLADWSRICRRLYVWDYAINYARTVGVFPNFGVLQRNMQVFCEHNVKGVYEEGNFYMDTCDTEFGELKGYLLSKLMQDPYLDYDAQMNGFLAAYYGEGWQHIRSIIDTMSTHSANTLVHLPIRQWMCFTLPGMTRQDVRAVDAHWQAAKEAAADAAQVERIERSRLSWRVWKCANLRAEFSPLHGICAHAQSVHALYEDLLSFGVTTMGEREHRAEFFRFSGKVIQLYYSLTRWLPW
ncbi:MAG: DUF4838 domain-containing protein [Clostridia bacterium]|nr:DUF4838 domain-containing protein [Clostridia bacterium]